MFVDVRRSQVEDAATLKPDTMGSRRAHCHHRVTAMFTPSVPALPSQVTPGSLTLTTSAFTGITTIAPDPTTIATMATPIVVTVIVVRRIVQAPH
jgi:hypothetical protein